MLHAPAPEWYLEGLLSSAESMLSMVSARTDPVLRKENADRACREAERAALDRIGAVGGGTSIW